MLKRQQFDKIVCLNCPQYSKIYGVFLQMNFLENRRWDDTRRQKVLSYVILGLMGWYVFLCVANYFHQRPLWNDERAVFQSVEVYEGVDYFTKVLINGQNFPRLYLCLIQKISQPFQFSLLSLRFLSFVFMLTAFCAWMRVARYELKNNVHFLMYVLCWLASNALIYYSSELKQYSMDVLSSAVFLLFIYNQDRLEKSGRRLRYALILAVLPAVIFFSYTAFFFFIFPLYNLVVSAKEKRPVIGYIVIYSVSLLVCGFLAYYFDMRLRDVHGYNDYFVSYASVRDFFKTFGEGTRNLFSRWLVERPRVLKRIAFFFFTFGFLNMFGSFFARIKKDGYRLKSMNTVGLIVFFELFIMGSFKSYPFSVLRTSLFFCPILLYLTIQGITAVKKINVYLYRFVFVSFFVFLSFIAVQLSYSFLSGKIELTPLLWWFGTQ